MIRAIGRRRLVTRDGVHAGQGGQRARHEVDGADPQAAVGRPLIPAGNPRSIYNQTLAPADVCQYYQRPAGLRNPRLTPPARSR
jgi:hypothetical protein